ncbi:MAG: tail fiber domain-containing protein [Saprospiraceae bacterium]|nr:tail fiber domain-containing protein [Lewinella sp.]
MKKRVQLLSLLLLLSQLSFAQFKVIGKGIIGGSEMPEDAFQVNGDMQLAESSPFLRLMSTTGANAGINWKSATESNLGALFLDPDTGNFFFDINGFSTNGAEAEFTFDANGRLGIGYNNPIAPLHILNAGEELVHLESSAASKLLAFYQEGVRKGILSNVNNDLIFGVDDAGGQFKFQVEGNTRLTLENDGDLLAGTTNRLSTYTLAHADGSGAENGFTLLNSGVEGRYWNLYVNNETANFQLFQNGVFKGRFLASDGTYTPTSDKRYKSDIQELDAVLDRIRQLRPATYHMKHDPSGREHIGFIAQEVAEVFPQMVYAGPVGDTDEEAYTMNYNSMAVVAVKGIQELSTQETLLEEKQEKLEKEMSSLRAENQWLRDELQAMNTTVQDLKKLLAVVAQVQENCCQMSATDMVMPNLENKATSGEDRAVLKQNSPNPFDRESRIEFFIPEQAQEAYLTISDISGRILKQISLTQRGTGEIKLKVGDVPAGQHTYSLFVDDELIETRKMVVIN